MSTANNQNGNQNPENLENQANHARADMSRTLDALEQKFSPGQLFDQSLDMMREHGGEFAGNLGRTVKQNPVPLLLTTVGLAWLAASSNRQGAYASNYPVPRDQLGGANPVYPGNSPDAYSGTYAETYAGLGAEQDQEGAGNKMKDKAGAAKEKAGAMGRSVKETAAEAKQRLSDTARHQGQAAHSMQHQAAHQMHQAEDQFGRMLREQPLVLSALAVAFGASIGAALPRTERENQMLGRQRDELVDKGKQQAASQYDQVRDQVKENVEQATEAVQQRNQGNGKTRGDNLSH